MGTFQSKNENKDSFIPPSGEGNKDLLYETEDLFLDWIRDFPSSDIEEKEVSDNNQNSSPSQSEENISDIFISDQQEQKRKILHKDKVSVLNIHTFSRIPNGKSPNNGKTFRRGQYKSTINIERGTSSFGSIIDEYGFERDNRPGLKVFKYFRFKPSDTWKVIELLEENHVKKISTHKNEIRYYLQTTLKLVNGDWKPIEEGDLNEDEICIEYIVTSTSSISRKRKNHFSWCREKEFKKKIKYPKFIINED